MSIDHEPIPLAQYRGNVLLIANTASFCGFTPQYRGLEYLYRTYRARGFVVLGFPSNDFIQEPLGDKRISEFCVRNYGVSFPMFGKVTVNGPDTAPLFKLLKARARGLFGSEAIKWNFTKFLVDRNGTVIGRFGPTTFPRQLSSRIESLLD
jgi:glutathione peroxidase